MENEHEKTRSWTPDDTQQQVIEAGVGYHLVLAPPGCGKTQILAERLRRAHEKLNVAYDDMLCLTFTNRAAREMQSRVRTAIADNTDDSLFIGNVHRYCVHFLFTNNLVPAESSVIDDDDAISILATYLNEDEDAVKTDFNRKQGYEELYFFSHLMYQLAHRHQPKLRLHADSMNSDDILVMKQICKVERKAFTLESVLDIYEHNDYYVDAVKCDAYDEGVRKLAFRLLHKMRFAHAYTAYKKQNKLLDFEDLLLLSYNAMLVSDHHRYHWIQVDEVQDLNPLQLAIIDLLTAEDSPSVMYLGDEQQAIFSFMGAKLDTLTLLKSRCNDHVHHLGVNHRSPGYLLNVLNTYATDMLGIDKQLLPQASNMKKGTGRELRLLSSDTLESEYIDIAQFATNLYQEDEHETTAVIVSSNNDAQAISEALSSLKTPHFKISGDDLFSSSGVKMLLAHLQVLANEGNFMAWSRLVRGMKALRTNSSARMFVRKLMTRAMLPSDFLLYDKDTYVGDFVKRYEQEELVVFDTETTGLNVFEDDIVQIAAVKVRNGRVVEGSQLSLYIQTDREIPAMLGDIENPIIEERKHHELLTHADALQKFMDYVGGDVLIGHNIEFDYHILDYNLRRYLPEINLESRCPARIDTLKLSRMLAPGMHDYKLKSLLASWHLEGSNTHLADEDVNATCSVLMHCYDLGCAILPSQRQYLADKHVQNSIKVWRNNYRQTYLQAREKLFVRLPEGSEPALIQELRHTYEQWVAARLMAPVDKMEYVIDYVWHDLLRPEVEPSLAEQLAHHATEIGTLKEADLCSSRNISNRVFVSTVHKAKGLEFDNVIVFDAVDGRYPNFFNQHNPRLLAEDKRKFYVALSRSRKRLFISRSMTRFDYRNQPHPRDLTPFMMPILHFFN